MPCPRRARRLPVQGRLPRRPKPLRLFATFQFGALPAKGRKVVVIWYAPGSKRPYVRDKQARRSKVVSWLSVAQAPRVRGRWRADLRVKGRLVGRTRILVR